MIEAQSLLPYTVSVGRRINELGATGSTSKRREDLIHLLDLLVWPLFFSTWFKEVELRVSFCILINDRIGDRYQSDKKRIQGLD